MGLKESKDNKLDYSIIGTYRNHHIKIFETWEPVAATDGHESYTNYDIEVKNAPIIPIFIREQKGTQYYFFSLRQVRDAKRIVVGEFVVIITKDNENDVRLY